MRPHADGTTGETREMQELRRLPNDYLAQQYSSIKKSIRKGAFFVQERKTMTNSEIRIFKDIADELRRIRMVLEKIAEANKDDDSNGEQEGFLWIPFLLAYV